MREREREHEWEHEQGTTGDRRAPRRSGSWAGRRSATRDEYAAAFERVRLVRAWIAAAAALVAVISAYVAVIERVVR
ncbi:MAG TPA: hypothetical protein VF461_24670 [Gemmatimonadaceae bacterium]